MVHCRTPRLLSLATLPLALLAGCSSGEDAPGSVHVEAGHVESWGTRSMEATQPVSEILA